MKATSTALPKNLIRPVRSSKASTAFQKSFLITMTLPARLFDWNRAGEDFDLTVAHADRILEQSARRRPGSHAPVGIVDAPMAGTHEEVGRREPSHGASEVRAVDREVH